VGPLSTNIIYHPGGAICAFGGAVTYLLISIAICSQIFQNTYGTSSARTSNRRKQRPLPHTIPMRRAHTPQQTDFHSPNTTLKTHTCTVRPVRTSYRKGRFCSSTEQVRGSENFDTVLFGPRPGRACIVACWVRARDHDAPVEEYNCFAVVQASHCCIGHY
jgi:hypothetical protein